jgi:arylamine N-acetyltransferase
VQIDDNQSVFGLDLHALGFEYQETSARVLLRKKKKNHTHALSRLMCFSLQIYW